MALYAQLLLRTRGQSHLALGLRRLQDLASGTRAAAGA